MANQAATKSPSAQHNAPKQASQQMETKNPRPEVSEGNENGGEKKRGRKPGSGKKEKIGLHPALNGNPKAKNVFSSVPSDWATKNDKGEWEPKFKKLKKDNFTTESLFDEYVEQYGLGRKYYPSLLNEAGERTETLPEFPANVSIDVIYDFSADGKPIVNLRPVDFDNVVDYFTGVQKILEKELATVKKYIADPAKWKKENLAIKAVDKIGKMDADPQAVMVKFLEKLSLVYDTLSPEMRKMVDDGRTTGLIS